MLGYGLVLLPEPGTVLAMLGTGAGGIGGGAMAAAGGAPLIRMGAFILKLCVSAPILASSSTVYSIWMCLPEVEGGMCWGKGTWHSKLVADPGCSAPCGQLTSTLTTKVRKPDRP
uniref:Uncharacterized protein n=1 Tax=Dunaliella tertiolecta TaxID=3047 RepID=A0A7S3VSK3_DUNTE